MISDCWCTVPLCHDSHISFAKHSVTYNNCRKFTTSKFDLNFPIIGRFGKRKSFINCFQLRSLVVGKYYIRKIQNLTIHEMVVWYIQGNRKNTVKARGRKVMTKLKKKVEFYPSVECTLLSCRDIENDRKELIRFHKISNWIE